MDVLSICPLRIAAFFWQPSPGTFALSVACKATYRLAPGRAVLSDQPEDPNEHDSYWDDDPSRSLHVPSDIVPRKARADVVLVGSAFAPRKESVSSLSARLSVGSIDKVVEVFCDRYATADGAVVETSRFTSMPLQYERAAGGPGTWNPVGVRLGAVSDGEGRIRLPNLQPSGTSDLRRMTPVGYGPIAPTWPTRLAKLGPSASGGGPPNWRREPLPSGFDLSYFNVAPPDQQLDALRGDERIVLRNLNAEHMHLETVLPGSHPSAIVELPGLPTREIAAVGDTLWIDTDRAVATLTFRFFFAVTHPTAGGRVIVAMADLGERVPWAEIRQRRGGFRGDLLQQHVRPALADGVSGDASRASHPSFVAKLDEELGVTSTAKIVSVRSEPVLPFVRKPGDEEMRSGPGGASSLPFAPVPRAGEPGSGHAVPPLIEAPPLVQPPRAGGLDELQASPWITGRPPGEGASIGRPAAGASGDTSSDAGAPPPSVPRTAAGSPSPTAGPASVGPTRAGRHRMGVGKEPQEPASGSAVAASNAAAASEWASGDRPLSIPAEPAPRRPPQEIIELLWYEPAALSRIRKQPEWKHLVPSRPTKPSADDADAQRDKRMEARDRRDVLAVLQGGLPLDAAGIDQVIVEAMTDGVFVPPLALVTGELEFLFDEVETLKAIIAAVTPFVAGDKKLKDAADAANELLNSPWIGGAAAIAERMTTRIKEAFAQERRAMSAAHLEAQATHMLLRRRQYQKRTLLGKEWIVCLLCPAPGSRLACYLPASLENELPMFQRFNVKVITEARPPIDQYAESTPALLLVALTRLHPIPNKAALARNGV